MTITKIKNPLNQVGGYMVISMRNNIWEITDVYGSLQEGVKPFSLSTCKSFVQDRLASSIRYKEENTAEAIVQDRPLYLVKDMRPTSSVDKAKNALWEIEDLLGFDRSRVYDLDWSEATLRQNIYHKVNVEDFKKSFSLYEGDPRWLTCLPLVSLYTLLIRVGSMNTESSFLGLMESMRAVDYVLPYPVGSDQRYMQDISHTGKWLGFLLKYGLSVFCPEQKDNYYKKIDSHDSGISQYAKWVDNLLTEYGEKMYIVKGWKHPDRM